MSTEPKVSIIIPVYKGERYIADAIQSVLEQSYQHYEMIIVNDGSPDNSRNKIEPYLHLPKLKYLEQENKGVSAARNLAIRHASGELVAFLDHDDLWLPDKLQTQVTYWRQHPEVGLVHSNYRNIATDGSPLPDMRSPRWPTDVEGDCFKELFIRNRIAMVTTIVSMKALEQVGAFNESIRGAEDYELWLRIAHAFPVGYVPEVLALYRVHDTNASHDKLKMTLAELQAMESVVRLIPDIEASVGKEALNARLYELNFEVGSYLTWLAQDYAGAKSYFLKAVKRKPMSLHAYGRLLWCSLSASQRRALQWHLSKLRNH